MEELIRWIFIIIFIYSILKGLFSKKKPAEDNQQAAKRIPGEGTLSSGTTVPQTSRRQTELTLEDIFGKLPDNKPTEQNIPAKSQNSNNYGYTTDKYSENNSFDSPVDYDRGKTVSRETIIAERVREKTDENKKKKRELSKLNDMLRTEKIYNAREPEIISDIRKKISEPETLREMFIVSEILNKPKALRRW